MKAIGWKFMAIYCGWIAFEWLFIFFMYPETQGRTLEELTFCKYLAAVDLILFTDVLETVFEDKELAERAVIAVEKEIHYDVDVSETKQNVLQSQKASENTATARV